MTSTVKSSVTLVLPKPPRIKRQHLRKYSWLPDVFRIEGSIITRIIGPVLTVTIFATLIAYLFKRGYDVTLTNSVVPVVAVVVGLILVFRNGTSYDRFYEGRKDFATMTSQIRNLSRLVWVNVSVPPPDYINTTKGKTPHVALTAAQLRRKKIDVLKLALSFAYAVKHYLRDEDGIHWEDYSGVLPASFARYDETGYTHANNSYASLETSLSASMSPTSPTTPATSKPGTMRQGRSDATKRVRPKRKDGKVTPKTPLLAEAHQTVEFHAYADEASLPLPLVIAHEIGRAVFRFKRDGYLETVGPAGTNALNQLLQGMVDQMTAMERVANTPIPVSYRIHLKQAVTLYLFALPFTLIKELGWSMIPIVTVVAFTFMGIEGIADEIENPFGHDKSDLPLDRYCADLKEEIDYIIERLPEGGEGMFGFDDGEGDD